MDEETRQLLRRIVESLASRQLASIDILGHCLKFVGELDTKLRVVGELDLALRLYREVHALYDQLGWSELEVAVRERLDRIPYPQTRLEFGVAYYLTGLTEQVAMEAYAESSCPEFAAIARSYVEAAARRPEPKRFLEFASEPTNRPRAQEFLNRWLGISLSSFGRPDTPADARAVELGIRSQPIAAMVKEFEQRLAPFLVRTGLDHPSSLEREAQDRPRLARP